MSQGGLQSGLWANPSAPAALFASGRGRGGWALAAECRRPPVPRRRALHELGARAPGRLIRLARRERRPDRRLPPARKHGPQSALALSLRVRSGLRRRPASSSRHDHRLVKRGTTSAPLRSACRTAKCEIGPVILGTARAWAPPGESRSRPGLPRALPAHAPPSARKPTMLGKSKDRIGVHPRSSRWTRPQARYGAAVTLAHRVALAVALAPERHAVVVGGLALALEIFDHVVGDRLDLLRAQEARGLGREVGAEIRLGHAAVA